MSEMLSPASQVVSWVVCWFALYAVGVAVSAWVRGRKGRR